MRTTVCAGLLALGVAACGGGGRADRDSSADTAARPAARALPPDQQVRQVIGAFGKATLRRDWRAICRELLTTSLVQNVEQYGRRCEDVWQANLEGVVAPRLTVRSVEVKGASAVAEVTSKAIGEEAADVRLTLVRAGAGWRISSQS